MNSLCSGSEVGQRLDGVPSEHWRFSEGDLWQSWLKEFNSRARLIDSRIMNSIDAVSCAEGLGRLVRAGTIVSCSHVLDQTLPTLNELRLHVEATGRDALTWEDIGNYRVRDAGGHVLDIDRRAGAAGKSALSALLADQLRKSESCKRLEYRTLTFAQGVGFHGTLWDLLFYEQCAGRIPRDTKFEAAWRAATTRHKAVRPVLDSATTLKVKTLCSWANVSENCKLQVKRVCDGLHRFEFLRTLVRPDNDLAFAMRLVVCWFRFILRFFRLLSSLNKGRRLRDRVGKLAKIQRTFTVLRN